MIISDSIFYVGVDDETLDYFEGQYALKNGVSYNSYVIIDKKISVLDTADKRKIDDWMVKVERALCGKIPDYLIISHMEPDHSAAIGTFLSKYPTAVVVGNEKTFEIAVRFFGNIFENRLTVKDGDELTLGEHTLKFIFAPMVHWPEVMFTYDKKDRVLFSADAFGKFGTLDVDEDWCNEARRYYFNIVGKYGATVQSALKKISALDIASICSLHGPILTKNIDDCIDKYNTWSLYLPEESGVFIAYASIYGNTATAVKKLESCLNENGVKTVVYDLMRDDMASALADAFRYDRAVVASATYDGGLLPVVEMFINRLKSKNYQNRKVAFIENGSWAPAAHKLMRSQFETFKNITFLENTVSIRSTVTDETVSSIKALAKELIG